MEFMNMVFGAKQVQKDQKAHHKSLRAVLAHELDFFVADAKRPGSVWVKYSDLDDGIDGEMLAETENLDVATPQNTTTKELSWMERVRAVLDILNESEVAEESDDEATTGDEKETASADERTERRRRHLLEDEEVPGTSLLSKRASPLTSSDEEEGSVGKSQPTGNFVRGRDGGRGKRRRPTG